MSIIIEFQVVILNELDLIKLPINLKVTILLAINIKLISREHLSLTKIW